MTRSTSHNRARRLLVPAWPPESVGEALLLGMCVVGLRILFDLWLPVQQVLPLYASPGVQALVLLGEALRWTVMGLAFALAARLILKADATMALAVGGAVLLALCAEPVAGSLWPELSFDQMLAVSGASVAVMAGLMGRTQTRHPDRLGAFVVVAVLIALAVLRYEQLHAWCLDLGGFAVKGALIADRNEAHRTFLLHLPLLAVVLVLWMVTGGEAARRAWRIVEREWPATVLAFLALSVAWGYVVAAQTQSLGLQAWLPSLFLPPSIYGLLGVILGLALIGVMGASICGRVRRRSSVLSAGDVLALAVVVCLLGVGVSVLVLPALAVFALILLIVIWPLGGSRPSVVLALVGGGLMALAAFWAGALALPDLNLENFMSRRLLFVTVFGAGAAVAGLAHLDDESTGRGSARTDRPRLMTVVWLINLGVAFAIAIALTGVARVPLWVMTGLAVLGLTVIALCDRRHGRGNRLMVLTCLASALLLIVSTGMMLV
jgi:hypothetical protein